MWPLFESGYYSREVFIYFSHSRPLPCLKYFFGSSSGMHEACAHVLFDKSGDYFFQHFWRCGNNLIAATTREWCLIEQIWHVRLILTLCKD